MTLSEDARVLKVDAELDASNPDVQRLISPLERGDMDAMSMAFRVTGQQWNEDKTERLITALSIHRGDVSVVSSPANESTSVSLRAAELSDPKPSVTRRSHLELAESYKVKGTTTARKPTAAGTRSRWEARAYSQAQIDQLGKAGKAHKARDGHYAFPVNSKEDVENAVKAVGRAPEGERGSIRRFIMLRARELSASALIPSTWQATGSLAA